MMSAVNSEEFTRVLTFTLDDMMSAVNSEEFTRVLTFTLDDMMSAVNFRYETVPLLEHWRSLTSTSSHYNSPYSLHISC